jgi:hypothetical protein
MSPHDELISELGASLSPSQYADFSAAARAALEGLVCSGPGAAYRILADLQRRFFEPPPDTRHANLGARHRGNKLSDLPPIGADDPRTGGRDRRRLKAVG